MAQNPWENDTTDPNSIHEPEAGKRTTIVMLVIIGVLIVAVLIGLTNYRGGFLHKNDPASVNRKKEVKYSNNDIHYAFVIPNTPLYQVRKNPTTTGNIKSNVSIGRNVFITEYKLDEKIVLTDKNYREVFQQLVNQAAKYKNVEVSKKPVLVKIGKDNSILSLHAQIKTGNKPEDKNNLWFFFVDKSEIQINCQKEINKECKTLLKNITVANT